MERGPTFSPADRASEGIRGLPLTTCFILAAAATCVTLVTLVQDSRFFLDYSARQSWRLSPPDDDWSLLQVLEDKCWAGVYIDSATHELLHLGVGGRAFRSPGSTTVGSPQQCLRWREKERFLHLADCNDANFRWPDAAGDVQQNPGHAGQLVGFGAEAKTNLVRDPMGFLFPGSMYTLSLTGDSRWQGDAHEMHVVIHADGTVTSVASGLPIATWSFAETKSFSGNTVDECWPPGDTVVLLVDAGYGYNTHEVAAAGVVGAVRRFELSSADGGRTWIPMHRHSQARVLRRSDVRAHVSGGGSSGAVLSLMTPSAASIFPITPAVVPVVTYLKENKTRGFSPEDQSVMAAGDIKLQPIIEVFEAQPFRIGTAGDGEHVSQHLEAIIVISRAVPRPIERRSDLSCVMNGAISRAIWLSWSMVLCSTTNVKPEKVNLFLAFQGKRVSLDFSFLHTPPPRHTRLAWPAKEGFDIRPQNVSRNTCDAEHPCPVAKSGGSGVSGFEPWETTLAICTMFKNEAPYLEEWLQYHRALGVSKVYMYDDGSSDESRERLRKHEMSGYVHVRDWHHRGAQTEALNDCLCRYRHTARWMSFIDVDEFIDPAPGTPMHSTSNSSQGQTRALDEDRFVFDNVSMATRRRLLLSLLERSSPERHTHCMPWANYCSFGQLSKPLGGVVESYVQLEVMEKRKIHMQKPLFKALESLTLRMIGPHFLLYATEDIEQQYRRNLGCPYEWLDPDAFHIRHYRSKSLEEYVERRAGADAAYQNKRYAKEQLKVEWHEANARCGKGRS